MNEIVGASPASTSVLVGLSRLEAKLDDLARYADAVAAHVLRA